MIYEKLKNQKMRKASKDIRNKAVKLGIIILLVGVMFLGYVMFTKEKVISCPNVSLFTLTTTNPLVYEPVGVTVAIGPQEKQRITGWNIVTSEGEWG